MAGKLCNCSLAVSGPADPVADLPYSQSRVRDVLSLILAQRGPDLSFGVIEVLEKMTN